MGIIYIIEELFEATEEFEVIGFVTNEDEAERITENEKTLQYREINELEQG